MDYKELFGSDSDLYRPSMYSQSPSQNNEPETAEIDMKPSIASLADGLGLENLNGSYLYD